MTKEHVKYFMLMTILFILNINKILMESDSNIII